MCYRWFSTAGYVGVYMTPGRLSPRSEFTPVPSHGSIFVYMIPPQNVMPARVTPAWVHHVRYEISQRYHVTADVNAKRPPVSVRLRSVCRLEAWKGSACLVFAILNHTCVLPTWSVPLNNEILKPVTLLYVSWFSPENGSRFEGSEYCLFQIFVVKMTHLTSFSWWRLTKKKLRKAGHQKILHISLGDL